MPFDNPPANRKREILEDMSRILARPESWCQDEFERNGAVCIARAAQIACADYFETREVINLLLVTVGSSEDEGCIGDINDRPETTHSDILAWIERAKERVA